MPMLGRVLAATAGSIVGAFAGVVGSFVHGYTVVGVPIGLVTALGLSLLVFMTSGVAARGRAGPALSAAGWLLSVLLLTVRRPEGDLIVAGTGLGYAWLIGGTILGAWTVAWPYGSWLPGAGNDRMATMSSTSI